MQISKLDKDNFVIKCKEGIVKAGPQGIEIEGLLFNGPGEYERKGIFVEGLEPDSVGILFLIHAEDINICYGAELKGPLSGEAVKSLGDVDLLIISIDENGGLSVKDAEKIISTIDPRVIIPVRVSSDINLQHSLNINMEIVDSYRFKKSDLPTEDRKLIVIN